MSHPFYRIAAVEAADKSWKLFNEASGQFAGDRLRKGESKTASWPFKAGNWTTYDTKKGAEEAATKLQDYLEAFEGKKTKK